MRMPMPGIAVTKHQKIDSLSTRSRHTATGRQANAPNTTMLSLGTRPRGSWMMAAETASKRMVRLRTSLSSSSPTNINNPAATATPTAMRASTILAFSKFPSSRKTIMTTYPSICSENIAVFVFQSFFTIHPFRDLAYGRPQATEKHYTTYQPILSRPATAADCSASCFDCPSPRAISSEPMNTPTVKRLSWSGPTSESVSYEGVVPRFSCAIS